MHGYHAEPDWMRDFDVSEEKRKRLERKQRRDKRREKARHEAAHFKKKIMATLVRPLTRPISALLGFRGGRSADERPVGSVHSVARIRTHVSTIRTHPSLSYPQIGICRRYKTGCNPER